MKNNFDVFLTENVVSFILGLDIKVQEKIAYNIQKARQLRDPKILKKVNKDIWEFKTRYK